MNPFELLRRVFSPGTAGEAAKPAPDPEKHEQDRQNLTHNAKIAAVALGVLLVLTLEYTPMVVADYQLEHQYADQVRALVLVEGHATTLDRLVADGSSAWKARMDEHIGRAIRRIDELDRYNQNLAASPPVPAFLDACREDLVVDQWLAANAIDANWRDIVARCVIEPMRNEFDRDGEDQFRVELLGVLDRLDVAITQARQAFSLEPSGHATAGSLEDEARVGLDLLRDQILDLKHAVEAGPYAVAPSPSQWARTYAASDSSLRSFRDALLFAHASPLVAQDTMPGAGAIAIRSSARAARAPVRPNQIRPPAVSVTAPDLSPEQAIAKLNVAIDKVMGSQVTLQAEQANRTSDVKESLPDWLKPVLAVLRPKYLVLGYPIVLAIVGAYLLAGYTRIWRHARSSGLDNDGGLSPLFFGGLVVVPVAVLVGLFWAYDWPQFGQTWWQWTHRGPLVFFILVVLGCALFLRPPAGGGGGAASE